MAARNVKGIKFQYYIWGENPVQALGDVRNREFQFRADRDEWVIEVADNKGVLPSNGGHGMVEKGTRPDAGQMPHDEAVKIINFFLSEYVAASD